MSKKRGRGHYRALLMGLKDRTGDEYAGVRSYAHGFTAADGYDMRKFNDWTPAQKAKLTKYADSIMRSRAKPHVEYRDRDAGHDKNKLRAAVERFNAEPLKGMKTAFVPYVAPRGEKDVRPKIDIGADYVTISSRHYEKTFIPFDAISLALDPDAEIARVRAKLHNLSTVTIQCGLYEQGNVYHGTLLNREVKNMMMRYDGKTHLPHKPAKWRAHHHKWEDWLIGLNGYRFVAGGSEKQMLYDKWRATMKSKRHGRHERYKLRDRITKAEFTEHIAEVFKGKSRDWIANYQTMLARKGQYKLEKLTEKYLAAQYAKKHPIEQDEDDFDEDDFDDE